MQDIIQDKIAFKLKVDEQKDKLELLAQENTNLKEKVTDQEEDIKRLRK
jgi:hypothetical protein